MAEHAVLSTVFEKNDCRVPVFLLVNTESVNIFRQLFYLQKRTIYHKSVPQSCRRRHLSPDVLSVSNRKISSNCLKYHQVFVL